MRKATTATVLHPVQAQITDSGGSIVPPTSSSLSSLSSLEMCRVVRERCVPLLTWSDCDCVITSLPGSGKKTALGIALLHQTSTDSSYGAIVLVPTRQHASQVRERLISLNRRRREETSTDNTSKHLSPHIIPLCDFSMNLEAAAQHCYQPGTVCIGTAGCMLDALRLKLRQIPVEEESIGGYRRHSTVSHQPIGKRFIVALVNADLFTHSELLGCIYPLLSLLGHYGNRCRLIVLASRIPKFTLGEFIEAFMRQPRFLLIDAEQCLGSRVKYSYVRFPSAAGAVRYTGSIFRQKLTVMVQLCRRLNGRRLGVFCNSAETASQLFSGLQDSGIFASMMSCEERSEECERVQRMFSTGQSTVLVTTDAYASYVSRLSMLLNFEFPLNRSQFLNRLGCCDRFSAGSQSGSCSVVSFVLDRDMPLLRELERTLHLSMKSIDLDS